MKALIAILFLGLALPATAQEEVPEGISTIKNIDLSEDKPAPIQYFAVTLSVPKPNKNISIVQLVFRQLSGRVRVEFEGEVPKGHYALALSDQCPGRGSSLSESHYRKSYREVHTFHATSAHVATEKSIPGAALTDTTAKIMLKGQAVTLFHMDKKKFEAIDCKVLG